MTGGKAELDPGGPLPGIKTVLEDLQIATTQRLLEKCLGLSLSDQYWICPQSRNSKVVREINFFEK
ncbi:MAG: hypothetical protein ACLTS6_14760 [Anaerobutyricum sp.]